MPSSLMGYAVVWLGPGLRELPGMSYMGGNYVNLLMPENIIILSPALTGQSSAECK